MSDHRPVSFCLRCTVTHCASFENTHSRKYVPDWNGCSSANLNSYAYYLDTLLQSIVVPHYIFAESTDANMHHILIDKLYRQIIDCINRAAAVCIPTCKQDRTVYNVPGWNTYVAERHETARNAYLLWLDSGKLRHG